MTERVNLNEILSLEELEYARAQKIGWRHTGAGYLYPDGIMPDDELALTFNEGQEWVLDGEVIFSSVMSPEEIKKAIYVDGERIEIHNSPPELEIVYTSPRPRNSAGGKVFCRAVWVEDYTSAAERDNLEKFLRENPSAAELPVWGIELTAYTRGYGCAGVIVKW